MSEKCSNCGKPLIAQETERCAPCINPGDGVDSYGLRTRIVELEGERDGLSAELDRLEKRFKATDEHRDKAESFSAAAKDALEAWQYWNSLNHLTAADVEYDAALQKAEKLTEDALSNTPSARRHDAELRAYYRERIVSFASRATRLRDISWAKETLEGGDAIAQRFLDSMKEKP